MHKVPLALAAAIALVTLPGCGATGKAIATLSTFDAQSNAICTRLSEKQAAIVARSHALGETGQSFWLEIMTASRAADGEVNGLERPTAQAAAIKHLVAGYFEEASYEETISNAYVNNDPRALEITNSALAILTRRDAVVAESLGMTACDKTEANSSPSEQGASV